jgi:hypothetical protein
MEARFSHSWSTSLQTFLKNYLLVLVTTLVSGILSIVLACTGIGLLIVPTILGGAGRIYLKIIRGEKVLFGKDLFSCFSIWWTLFAASFVKWLAITVGLAILIVPGIYLMTRWYFVFPLIFDKGCTFSEAFSKSNEMTKGRFWEVFAMLLLIGVINSILGAVNLAYLLLGGYPWLTYLTYFESFSDTGSVTVEIIQ